jgi:putative hydrolase of the HAD superfamily
MIIRMVFFDLGDTLVAIKPDVYADLAQEITLTNGRFIGPSDLERAIKDEWVFRNGEDIGWVTTEESEKRYWQRFYYNVLQRLNVGAAPPTLLDLFSQRAADPRSFTCFDDVVGVLEALQQREIGIGLISNAFPSARCILDDLNLTHWFEPLVLSYEHPNTKPKPDPDIYNYALHCADILPEQAVFVDDRRKFVQGAKTVGMVARLIDRENSYGSSPNRILGLKELLEMF